MGLFDQNANNSSDGMFDMNHDGKLDPGEQSFMYETYDQIMNKPHDEHTNKTPEKDNMEKKDSEPLGALYIAIALVIFVILAVSCVGSM